MTETAEFVPTHTIGPIPVQRIEQEWPKEKAGWRPGKKLFPKFLDRFGNQIYTRKGLSAVPVGGIVEEVEPLEKIEVLPEEPFAEIPVFVTDISSEFRVSNDECRIANCDTQHSKLETRNSTHDAFEEPLLEFLDVDVAQAVFRAAAWPIFDEATGYAETMSGASAEVVGKTADGAKVVHVCVQGKWSRVLVPRLVPFQVLGE